MRAQNTLLKPNVAYNTSKWPMANLELGGQMGYAPNYAEYVANAAYIARPLISVLLEAPKAFKYLPNSQNFVGALRALMELHSLSIEGLNAGLDIETGSSTPVGGGGQVQEDVTDVKEVLSTPTHKFRERKNLAVYHLMRTWITYFFMDPNTKIPRIATLAGNKPLDLLPDQTTATMLYIEPDITNTQVVQAWVCTNMFPKTGISDITGKRDLTTALEDKTYDIGFANITVNNEGTRDFAQEILDSLSIVGADPFKRASFINSIDSDVIATAKSFAAGIKDVADSQVR
jgi:hypothetical protein